MFFAAVIFMNDFTLCCILNSSRPSPSPPASPPPFQDKQALASIGSAADKGPGPPSLHTTGAHRGTARTQRAASISTDRRRCVKQQRYPHTHQGTAQDGGGDTRYLAEREGGRGDGGRDSYNCKQITGAGRVWCQSTDCINK